MHVGKSEINTNQTFPRTSSCPIEDILTCDINIKDENLGVRQIFRWYKDDIPIPSCTTYTCKVAFTKAALKWERYAYVEETRQGSYHCEVSFAGLIKTFPSHKTDIFFSGTFRDLVFYFLAFVAIYKLGHFLQT